MRTFEITYLPATGRAPERIDAKAHVVDDSTSPPRHRFELRGRINASRWIERADVDSVREVTADPRPSFARQVSNREFPSGQTRREDR
jgi:hypothetical protein